MKNQRLLTILVVITLLFSISSTILNLLILKRNLLRDELMQAIGVMMMGSELDDEKAKSTTELQPLAQVEAVAETDAEPIEETNQPARPATTTAPKVSTSAPIAKVQAEEQPAADKQPAVVENVYVDLGLPSGTLWRSMNEQGLLNFKTAKQKYRKNLPSVKQWKELKKYCVWEWTGKGYQVTGPNGSTIYMPAEGYRNYSGIIGQVDKFGNYWSSTIKDSEEAWRFGFEPDKFSIAPNSRVYGRSVRLVQKRSRVPDITDIE